MWKCEVCGRVKSNPSLEPRGDRCCGEFMVRFFGFHQFDRKKLKSFLDSIDKNDYTHSLEIDGMTSRRYKKLKLKPGETSIIIIIKPRGAKNAETAEKS